MNPNQKQIAGISLNIIEPRVEMGEKKMRSNIKTKQHIKISKYQNIMEYCHNKTTDDLPVIKHHKNGTTPRRNLQRISGVDVSTICPTNSPG